MRREHIVSDTMSQLARIPQSEKKKLLKVKFINEEGIDEGSVQEEFFQVNMRQLLNPNFGMFTINDDKNTLWFNSDSLESTLEYELIGELINIAIYNGVILDLGQ